MLSHGYDTSDVRRHMFNTVQAGSFLLTDRTHPTSVSAASKALRTGPITGSGRENAPIYTPIAAVAAAPVRWNARESGIDSGKSVTPPGSIFAGVATVLKPLLGESSPVWLFLSARRPEGLVLHCA
jgi:hypothetical protein